MTSTETKNMEEIAAGMLLKFGLDLTLIILKNIQGVTTVNDAIAALENIKTSQQYVDEDSAARGVPSVPLPVPTVIPPAP